MKEGRKKLRNLIKEKAAKPMPKPFDARKKSLPFLKRLKAKGFRITDMKPLKKIKWNRGRNQLELGKLSKILTTNIIHVTDSGNIHLIPGYKYSRFLSYQAGKDYTKLRDDDKSVSVIFNDGHSEEGYVVSEQAPINFRIGAHKDNKAIIDLRYEYQKAIRELSDGTLIDTEKKMSKSQKQAMRNNFIGGLGLGVIMTLFSLGVIITIF